MNNGSNSSYCVRGATASIFAIAVALTHGLAVAQYMRSGSPVAAVRGPLRAFQPSDGFIDPAPTRYAFCRASLRTKSYALPSKQVFEGDTGWFFHADELDSNPSITPDLLDDFTRLTRTLAQRGTKLVVVVPPPRGLLAYSHLPPQARGTMATPYDARLRAYQSFVDHIRRAGPMVPDILAEANRNGVSLDRLTSPSDMHWSTTGAWITSLAVTRQIAPQKLKGGVPPLMGTASLVGAESYRTTLDTLCRTPGRGQTVRAFTLPAPPAPPATQNRADIILVGTSFSALTHRYGFAPFVQAYSGMATQNLAVAGGGPLTAFRQYAASERFKTDKPKFLIWEFSPSMMSDAGFASQLGGVLRTACPANTPATSAALGAGLSALATGEDIANAGPEGAPIQMTVKSDNAAFKRFTVFLNYVDGRQDTVDMDSRAAPDMAANYTFILPDDRAFLSDIAVRSNDPLSGTLRTQLCPAVDPVDPNPATPTLFSRLAAWFKSFWS
ncbi:alginate biosynthesis protein AlgX [soil metagenome]